MLVKEMVHAIETKTIKIAEIADKYSVSDRTIQNKLKKSGFVWDAKEAKYSFKGDNEILDKTIDEVFSTSKKAVKKVSKKTPENNSDIASNKDIDNIDRLLSGKKAKKSYRGFYLDSDVLAIIDSIDNGIKSELVNECLRKVFKDKGLL